MSISSPEAHQIADVAMAIAIGVGALLQSLPKPRRLAARGLLEDFRDRSREGGRVLTTDVLEQMIEAIDHR
jgi:hypothetical protein